jgi:diguanylate cyclase (GGDEF)-like protein
LELAEKIRETVESQTFAFGDHVLRVTVSIGVASGNDEATLVSEADRSMYAAKEAGRNCVRSQVLPG